MGRNRRRKDKRSHPPVPSERRAGLNGLVDKVKREVMHDITQRLKPQVRTMVRQEFFQGPIPPPSIMADYDSVMPGAADRILRIFEQQQNAVIRQGHHRMDLEKLAVSAEIQLAHRGWLSAFVLAILGYTVAAICAVYGSAAIGIASVLTATGSLVKAFLDRAAVKRRELESKAKEVDTFVEEGDGSQSWEATLHEAERPQVQQKLPLPAPDTLPDLAKDQPR